MTTYCESLVHNYRAARARIEAAGLNHQRAQFEATLPKISAPQTPPKRDWLILPEYDVFITKPKRIMDEVAVKHGVSVIDIKSARRQRNLVRARQEVMWRLKNETGWSLPQIGRFLGDRDHTTALHGIRRHQARIDAGEA